MVLKGKNIIFISMMERKYSKKEKGKLTYISEKQYRSATKNDVRVWAYNNTTKKELIKKLRK